MALPSIKIPSLRTLATKAFYLAVFLVLLCFQLPIWFWIEFSPKRRARSSWDLKTSLFVRVFKHSATQLALDLGMVGGNWRDPRVEPAEKELKEAKFVFVEGFPEEHIKGEVKEYVEKAEVQPERIGGYWFGRRGGKNEPIPPPGDDEKVCMLHLL